MPYKRKHRANNSKAVGTFAGRVGNKASPFSANKWGWWGLVNLGFLVLLGNLVKLVSLVILASLVSLAMQVKPVCLTAYTLKPALLLEHL